MSKHAKNSPITCTYSVDGMHCANCELTVERQFLAQPGVKSVAASLQTGEVTVTLNPKHKLDIAKVNDSLADSGYVVSTQPKKTIKNTKPFISFDKQGQIQINKAAGKTLLQNSTIVLLILAAFAILDRSGVVSQVASSASASLPAVFLLGLVASISTCAALVGGLLLSMTKSWNSSSIQPHLLFHSGRLLAFGLLGGALGAIGAALQLSTRFTAVVVMIVCVVMIISGLQMLNVGWASRIQLMLPKRWRQGLAAEGKFNAFGQIAPFLTGAITFLLPCSLTIIAQGLALNSGSFTQGAAIMFSFALGTLPVLLAISISSWKFNLNPSLGVRFQHIIAVIVIMLAAYNINANLNVLGLPSLNDIRFDSTEVATTGLPEVIDGKQTIAMAATPNGYSPSYFKVRAGTPVEWKINGSSIPSCASTIVANGLLTQAEVIKSGPNTFTFTAQKPGTYKFSCAMGMFSGIIEAV